MLIVAVIFALTGPWALTMPVNIIKAAETSSEVFFITFSHGGHIKLNRDYKINSGVE
jgi:hypothetical protein